MACAVVVCPGNKSSWKKARKTSVVSKHLVQRSLYPNVLSRSTSDKLKISNEEKNTDKNRR